MLATKQIIVRLFLPSLSPLLPYPNLHRLFLGLALCVLGQITENKRSHVSGEGEMSRKFRFSKPRTLPGTEQALRSYLLNVQMNDTILCFTAF